VQVKLNATVQAAVAVMASLLRAAELDMAAQQPTPPSLAQILPRHHRMSRLDYIGCSGDGSRFFGKLEASSILRVFPGKVPTPNTFDKAFTGVVLKFVQ
jgi:hypothetical protein